MSGDDNLLAAFGTVDLPTPGDVYLTICEAKLGRKGQPAAPLRQNCGFAAPESLALRLSAIGMESELATGATDLVVLHSEERDLSPQCSICSQALPPKPVCCAACKAVYYCGRECQRKDWSHSHKRMCSRLAAYMKDAPRAARFPLSFAAQTTTDRFRYGDWLRTQQLHMRGLWRRQCPARLICGRFHTTTR